FVHRASEGKTIALVVAARQHYIRAGGCDPQFDSFHTLRFEVRFTNQMTLLIGVDNDRDCERSDVRVVGLKGSRPGTSQAGRIRREGSGHEYSRAHGHSNQCNQPASVHSIVFHKDLSSRWRSKDLSRPTL